MTPILERPSLASAVSSDTALLDQHRRQVIAERKCQAKKIWVSVVSIIACLMALECLARITVALAHPPRLGNTEFDCKLRVAELSQKDVMSRLLFMGTSMTNRAIYSEMVSAHLKHAGVNVNAYNLGTSGAYPSDELFLLSQATSDPKAAPIAAIVFEVTPLVFAAKDGYGRNYSETFRKSYLGAALIQRDSGMLGAIQYHVGECFYLVRYRDFLLSTLRNLPGFVFNTSGQLVQDPTRMAKKEVSPQGWAAGYMVLGDDSADKSIAARKERMEELFPSGHFDKRNLRYTALEKVAPACASQHIPLVLLWLPVHQAYLEVCCKTMKMSEQEMHDALQLVADQNHALLLDLHDEPNSYHFSDCDHLNASGAAFFSEKIAAVLSQAPYREKLVAPAPVPVPVPTGVQKLVGSRSAENRQ